MRNQKVTIDKAFELFGKSFRKIRIANYGAANTHLDEFLKLIASHCIEDKIVELDMVFKIVFSQQTEQLLVTVVPFLRNVVNFCVFIIAGSSPNACATIFSMLPFGNVQSLTVLGEIPINFKWFKTVSIGCLQRVQINQCTNQADTIDFFKSQPNIKVFLCSDIKIHLESIANYVSNIEKISPIQTKFSRTLDDGTSVIKTWLPKLGKLKTLEIVAMLNDGRDMIEIITSVANENVLSSLVVRFGSFTRMPNSEQHANSITVNLSNLTHLRFCILPTSCGYRPWNDAAFENLVQSCLPHMKNVREFTIQVVRINSGLVLSIVKALEQLNVLAIETFFDITRLFYINLLAARKSVCDKPIECRLSYTDRHREAIGDVYDKNVIEICEFFETP